MIKVSRGAFEFRTKPSDFGNMGGRIRLLAEQKAMHTLNIGTAETMASATPSYSKELYEISCRVFGPVSTSVWHKDYHLKRAVTPHEVREDLMKEMYQCCLDGETDISDYTCIKWWQSGMQNIRPNATEYVRYAQDLIYNAEREDIPAWTFMLENGRYAIRLFARTAFLEASATGRAILNYVRMVKVFEERKRREKEERCARRFRK